MCFEWLYIYIYIYLNPNDMREDDTSKSNLLADGDEFGPLSVAGLVLTVTGIAAYNR